MNLPSTLGVMLETNLPVNEVTIDNSTGKVSVHWAKAPEQHEKELAQRFCMFNTVIHKW